MSREVPREIIPRYSYGDAGRVGSIGELPGFVISGWGSVFCDVFAKCLVDRLRIAEDFRYIRVEKDNVCSFPIRGGVLSPYSGAEVVLLAHLVVFFVTLTHGFVVLRLSPAAR